MIVEWNFHVVELPILEWYVQVPVHNVKNAKSTFKEESMKVHENSSYPCTVQ